MDFHLLDWELACDNHRRLWLANFHDGLLLY
jgi:hypothetical protein